MKQKLLCSFLLSFFIAKAALAGDKATVTFPSLDGITITADLYIQNDGKQNDDKNTPVIVLFHQAGWSRGEYLEIAPRLNRLGFNAMAVDLRSGGRVNEVKNETASRASAVGKGTGYVDTLPDMESAIIYARKHYGKGGVIVWGSSYSAALVLKIAGDRPGLVDGVLSFSPGEYFTRKGKPATWIRDSAKNISKPVFITSARNEKGAWFPIFQSIKSKSKVFYWPTTQGNHGSRALWRRFDDSTGYWKAVEDFLAGNFRGN